MRAAEIAIVVAVAENGIIGRDGGLPWRLPSDLKRFKALTMGKPIVMGRKTWDLLGGVLPGRPHIVISRRRDFAAEAVETAGSLDEALAKAARAARDIGAGEICIIGGGEVYAQTLPRADRLYVTHIEAAIDGDARFPRIEPALWGPVREERVPADERNSHTTRFVEYRRVGR